jgi:predicted branched-subunit amino acid permease
VTVGLQGTEEKKGSWSLWREGVRSAQPIMIGYFPVAVMFGISTRTAGLGALDALAMSVFIFAGAS